MFQSLKEETGRGSLEEKKHINLHSKGWSGEGIKRALGRACCSGFHSFLKMSLWFYIQHQMECYARP